MGNGRNRPVWISARGARGAAVDCVIKLSAAMETPVMAPLAYLCEWLASVLAIPLAIRTPRAFEVIVTSDFARSIADTEVRSWALASVGSVFGSEYVAGAGSPTQALKEAPHPEVLEPAADLLAFDAFIQNPDRRVGNPNLFVTRTEVVAYDHGDAFSFLFDLGGPKSSAEKPLLEMLETHAVRPWIRRHEPSLQPARERLESLTDELLDSILGCAPPAWRTGMASGKLEVIIEVLKLRRNAAPHWLPQVEAWLQK